jgi:hypothetical protein
MCLDIFNLFMVIQYIQKFMKGNIESFCICSMFLVISYRQLMRMYRSQLVTSQFSRLTVDIVLVNKLIVQQ